MQKVENLPVLILAYNRFDKFQRCLNNLINKGIKSIFISIDGPRDVFDIKNQVKIRHYCRTNPFGLDIKINQLEINYGCRIGPLKGINWFFQENKYGVILEDDVIISRACFQAFSFLLQENFYNDKYLSISSFNELYNQDLEYIYELPVWRSWGWASWSHKWMEHIKFSEEIKNYNLWDLYKVLPYKFRSIETAKLVKASQLNLLDAWDYEFNFSHIVNNKSSITIGGINCLVYGFDESATHTINLESLGIDFQLFRERKIDLNNIILKTNSESLSIINKCGFFYRERYEFTRLILDFFKSIFYSLLFYLRIIKRIFVKNLKKK